MDSLIQPSNQSKLQNPPVGQNRDIKWEGYVSLKSFIVKKAYAVITSDLVTIRKSQDADSAILHQFKKLDIQTFNLPRADAFTNVLMGYSGFDVHYLADSKMKKVNFWARGSLPAYPDAEQNPKLGEALANFADMEHIKTADIAANSVNNAMYGILIFSLIVGLVAGGFVGALLLLAAGALSFQVKKTTLPQWAKYLLYAALYSVATVIIIIIQFAILVALES